MTTVQKPIHWSFPEATLDRILSDIAAIGQAYQGDAISKQLLRDAYAGIRKDRRLYQMKYAFIVGCWESIAYPPKGIGSSSATDGSGPFMPKWKD